MSPDEYVIFADRDRHLVTVPYTREALLAAADELGINRAWLHRTDTRRKAHVDIPKGRVADVLANPRVHVVTARAILAITRRRD